MKNPLSFIKHKTIGLSCPFCKRNLIENIYGLVTCFNFDLGIMDKDFFVEHYIRIKSEKGFN
jgi:hypothetical protein